MRKKVLLQQIEMLIKKNDELYKDNVCLAEELEKKKALINELEQRLEEPDEQAQRFAVLEPEQLAAMVLQDEKAENGRRDGETATDVSAVPVIEMKADIDEPEQNEPGVDKTGDEPVDTASCSDEYEESDLHAAAAGSVKEIDASSRVIGEVVVRCASLCNEFTERGGGNAKDLVNLALGRTEVFKSEVLSAVTDGGDNISLQEKLDQLKNSVFEYFELLRSQI